MSSALSPMSAVPAAHYALVSLPEWQNLLRHFELSHGFAFIVLLVPDTGGAEGCRQALQRFLAASDQSLLTIPLPQPKDLKALPSQLLDVEVAPQAGAIWVEAVVSERANDYGVWRAAWREGVAKLNQFRNPLRRKFAVPLVFVGAPWMQEVLRDMAPDLWSVRTLVVRLALLGSASEASATALRSVATPHVPAADAAAPDPEYALQAAARVRGRRGQELPLAALLHRAGRGFLARSGWEQAEQVLSEAVALRTQYEPGSVDLAESVYGLAEALRWQYHYDRAVECLEQARRIYRQVGDVLGEANCIQRLGNIALARSDHATARQRYEEALPLFRQVGDVLGEANCIQGLGDIALARSDHATARLYFEDALSLYKRIAEPYSIGGTHRRLARLSGQESERSMHVEAARNAWASIGFTALVQQLEDEFATEN